MNLTSVGTSRCDVPARESAGGIVAPLNAARTARRAVPTRFNARSFVSEKSLLGGEGRDEGERFFKLILAAGAASPPRCLEGRLKEPGKTPKSNRQSQILNRKLIYAR